MKPSFGDIENQYTGISAEYKIETKLFCTKNRKY